MSTANDLFKAGQLQKAVEAQIQEVKANPADPSRRLFLFELAAFSGDLDRAKRQIDAVHYSDPERDAAVVRYATLLVAEGKRRRLFSEGLSPKLVGEAAEHDNERLGVLSRLREGRHAEATALLAQANAGASSLRGTLNGKPFEALRDTDDLFGLVLEVMAHGEYFWV